MTTCRLVEVWPTESWQGVPQVFEDDMPDIETACRYQDATLWPAEEADKHGQPTLGSSISLKVRWLWRRADVLDPLGNTITLDATVVVDREIAVGSRMQLLSAGEMCVVKIYNETPDIKNRAIRRTVGLMRMHEA